MDWWPVHSQAVMSAFSPGMVWLKCFLTYFFTQVIHLQNAEALYSQGHAPEHWIIWRVSILGWALIWKRYTQNALVWLTGGTELCRRISAQCQHKPTGLVSRVKVWSNTSKSSHQTCHQYVNSSLRVSAIVICSGNLPSLQKGKAERVGERDRTSCITFLNKCQAYF